MNLIKFVATLMFIAPASCQNLRADKVIDNPSTKKGPASRLSEDLIIIHQARHISRRLYEYVVEDDCIVGNLSGNETTTYCANEDLNCCSGIDSCHWDQTDVKICANSCTDDFSCYDGPSDVGPGNCTQFLSCASFAGEVVGANSCNGLHTCLDLQGSVGDDSCNSEKACMDLRGSVGDGSCNSEEACMDMSGSVGDGSCNSLRACEEAISVGDCVDACKFGDSCEDNTEEIFNLDTSQCSHSASPTTSPSSSPSVSPTTAPSSSPTERSGTELLTDAFNSLADFNQSGLPNQLKRAINSALTNLERAKNIDLNTDNLFSAIEDTARAGKALQCYPNPNPSFESVCDIIGNASSALSSLF